MERTSLRAWIARCWAMALLAVLCGCAVQIEGEGITHFDAADFVFFDGKMPPDSAPWTRQALPDDWRASRPGSTQAGWYRLQFEVPAGVQEPYLLYAVKLRDGAQIYLNGALLAAIRETDEDMRVRWNRPHDILIRPKDLHPGLNTVVLRVQPPTNEDTTWVGRFAVGPERLVRPLYDKRLFSVSTAQMLLATITGLMGIFVLSIWALRRMEIIYGLFGAGLVCWALRTLYYVIEVVPREWYDVWRAVQYTALGGFVVMMALFELRFVGFRWPKYERIALGFLALAPVVMMLPGARFHPFVVRYWQIGLMLLGIGSLYGIIRGSLKLRTLESRAVMIAVMLCVLAGIHDLLVSQGALPLEYTPFLGFANGILLTVMAVLLIDRFIGALRTAENAKVWLEKRVTEKERELAANYQKMREVEGQAVRMEERQRLMQDMHDGLGSHLLTSLGMIERGAIGTKEVAVILREAIDDLRLVIDMLTPEQSDFVAALGNLRYRLEPRFAAAGIKMQWNVRELPDAVDLTPEHSLQVLRIMQECFANITKHAKASEVTVTVRLVPGTTDQLEVKVEDNGVGLVKGAGTTQSRGMDNMRRRAEKLSAVLGFPQRPSGTCVELRLPVGT
jgi:signal transduction histidine kinase